MVDLSKFTLNKMMGKLQITPLKFRVDWILYPTFQKLDFTP